eukprot:m.227988 g.227988  ORF g.227988 m.227988 type:complete len:79 (+) comp40042_c0_seq1:101-337(+)
MTFTSHTVDNVTKIHLPTPRTSQCQECLESRKIYKVITPYFDRGRMSKDQTKKLRSSLDNKDVQRQTLAANQFIIDTQ